VATRAGFAEGVFPYLMRHTVVSLLLDGGATIEEVADLTGDDPATLYRHYRHKVRPVSMVAAERMPEVLGG
jgi:site-specific recombinase XerD